MGLIRRLSILAKADAHGVVDALEDRALILRQHVREAAAAVGRKRGRLDALELEIKDLRAEEKRLKSRMTASEADIGLAMEETEEDLARFAIKKWLPLKQRREQIEHRLGTLEQAKQELAQQLATQEAELEDLEQRVKVHLARLDQGEEARPWAADWPVRDEDVELELLRRRRVSGNEVEASDANH